MHFAALAFVLALLETPFAAEAQQPARKVPRIGYLSPVTVSADSEFFTAFREGLREHGYTEGQSIVIERRFADGNLERLADLASELVRLKVDVIVAASGRTAVEAQKATTTIPIVMTNTPDPAAFGIIATLARPGGNVTGLSMQTPDLSAKRVQLLKEAVPSLSRLTILWDSAGPRTTVTEAEVAARALGLRLQLLEARSASAIDAAFLAMTREGTHAAYVPGSALFMMHRARIAENAKKSQVPTICGAAEFGIAGCLMSYGVKLSDLYRRAASYVDRILKGARPADLPVEQPMKFELVVNLKTAKALGLTIPPSLVQRADRLIE